MDPIYSNAMQHFPLKKTQLEKAYDMENYQADYIDIAIEDCTKILAKIREVTGNDTVTTESKKILDWLAHALAMRILFQYTIDVWDIVYSKYEFKDKSEYPNNVPANTGYTARKRGKAPGRKCKVAEVFKRFDKANLPLLIYLDVEKELGETPVSAKWGKA